jgi:sec-independent protein translocase protein TatB
VRTVSIYIGKLRRSFNSVRNEIERELHTEEIKQELHNQAVLDSLKETEQQLREGLETPYDISYISGKKDADSNDTPPVT